MSTISVYLVVKNEARCLAQVLQAVQAADEIVVVDSGSSDDTLEIAKRFGARIVHQDWLGFAKQKAFALSLCQSEWALCLDGDEVLEQGGFDLIKKAVNQTEYPNNQQGFFLRRREYLMGHPIQGKRGYFLRLYRKVSAQWDETRLVHEHIDVCGKLAVLDVTIHHHTADSIATMMQKNNRYAQLKAEYRFLQNKKASYLRLFLVFPFMMLKFYVGRAYFLAGPYGLMYAAITSFYSFLTEANLWQLHHKKQQQGIE